MLDLIEKLATDEPEKFATFYKAFGNTLKEGICEDANHRERIAKLLRFASTKAEGAAQATSFDDYIGRMPLGQDTIWYITADSYAAALGSPQLEAFKAKGVEVLLMYDRIDEWMLGSLQEYAGKKLRNVAKGELPLDEADKKKREEASKQAEPLLKKLKELLGERVAEVKVSVRLTDSPSCLALGDYEMAPHLAGGQPAAPAGAAPRSRARRGQGQGSGHAAAGAGRNRRRRPLGRSGSLRAAPQSRAARSVGRINPQGTPAVGSAATDPPLTYRASPWHADPAYGLDPPYVGHGWLRPGPTGAACARRFPPAGRR